MKYILGIKCYTTDEVSDILDITVRTTLDLFKDDKIKATKIGYGYYVSEQNLISFIHKDKQEQMKV